MVVIVVTVVYIMCISTMFIKFVVHIVSHEAHMITKTALIEKVQFSHMHLF